jgi:hypothetical protein
MEREGTKKPQECDPKIIVPNADAAHHPNFSKKETAKNKLHKLGVLTNLFPAAAAQKGTTKRKPCPKGEKWNKKTRNCDPKIIVPASLDFADQLVAPKADKQLFVEEKPKAPAPEHPGLAALQQREAELTRKLNDSDDLDDSLDIDAEKNRSMIKSVLLKQN